MKKLLGIAVLGLLLSGNAYSKIYLTSCSYKMNSGVEAVGILYNEWTLDLQNMTINKRYIYDKDGQKKYGIKEGERNIKLIKIDEVTYRTEFMKSNTNSKRSFADVINIENGIVRSSTYKSSNNQLLMEVAVHTCKNVNNNYASKPKKKEEEKRIAEKSDEQIIELQNCKNIWKSSDPHRLNVSIDLNSLKITNKYSTNKMFKNNILNLDILKTSGVENLIRQKGIIQSNTINAIDLTSDAAHRSFRKVPADYKIDLTKKIVEIFFYFDQANLTKQEKQELKKIGIDISTYYTYPYQCSDYFVKGFDEEKRIAEKPKISPDDNKIVPAGSGSGFFVSSDGHIITNHHVIEGCNSTKVSFEGNQLEAKILAVDKMNDIAILKTNINPESIFPISNEDVSLLEDVVVAGYPLGKQVSSAIKTHKGVVTALAGAGDNYSNFQTDATINAGNSGGPIMNQKGNIVGIAVQTWVEEGVQGIHFGIKSSTLKTFANSNNLKFTQPNNRELSNKDLGKLITEATVYIECHMTIAKIKKMIAQADNRKAFFSEFK